MATRNALRAVSRRFSGKSLDEEEKAAAKVFIKKMEHDKLEKMARLKMEHDQREKLARLQVAGEQAAASSATSSSVTESGPKVSIGKYRNYAVVAGVVAVVGEIRCFMKSGTKKKPEVQE